MIYLTTVFLIALSSPALAPDCFFDPYKFKDSLGCNSSVQKSWAEKFYQKLSFTTLNQRNQVKDAEGIPVAEKLYFASEEFLKIHPSRARETATQISVLISRSLPYPEMSKDFAEASALKWLASEQLNDPLLLSENVNPFCDNEVFIEKLPLKYKTLAQSHCQNLKKRSIQLPKSGFIVGQSLPLPTTLYPGRYLIYVRNGPIISSKWLTVTNIDIKAEPIKDFHLWNHLTSTHLHYFASLKPAFISSSAITITTPPFNRIKVDLANSRQEIASVPDPFINQKRYSGTPLIKSTWFWIAVGVATGIGGFFAYDTLQTKRMRTP